MKQKHYVSTCTPHVITTKTVRCTDILKYAFRFYKRAKFRYSHHISIYAKTIVPTSISRHSEEPVYQDDYYWIQGFVVIAGCMDSSTDTSSAVPLSLPLCTFSGAGISSHAEHCAVEVLSRKLREAQKVT